VHTDHKASQSAKAVNALAYTVGHNVVFAGGQYAPGRKSGQRLLAHELTHVVQQRKMASAAPQSKLEIGPANDSLEQEADRFAEKMAGVSATATATPPTPPAGSSNGSRPLLQRAPADQAPATTAPALSAPGLIVDDEVQELADGQMHKTEFLDKLHAEVCVTSDAALAPVGRTSQGCPFIEKWIARLRGRSGQHIEKAIRKYAPESAGATRAADYIAPVGAKVQRGVSRWAATGEITGVPPELMAEVAGGGILDAIGSAFSGIISGIGGAISGVGHLFTKANDGGARTGNPLAIQSRLHSESNSMPLESGVRARMESAFGHSFGDVRVHDGSRAAHLSSSLNARAFTVGHDVAFAAGEYQPGTLIGDALIAHELAHVIQQGSGAPSAPMAKGATEYNSLEEDADVSAVNAMVSLWSGAKGSLKEIGKNAMPRLRSGLKLQRCGGNTPAPKSLDNRITAGKTLCADTGTGEPIVHVEKQVVPKCMLDCVIAHEEQHRQYLRPGCKALSASRQARDDAEKKAVQSGDEYSRLKNSNAPAPEVEAARKKMQTDDQANVAAGDSWVKLSQEYWQWVADHCQESEHKAYQAGIDKCNTPAVQKACADSNSSDEYQQNMKAWEKWKDNDPSCKPQAAVKAN
jgi:hypothetical protein